MNKLEKKTKLKQILASFNVFKVNLTTAKLEEFKILKKELAELLDDNQKIRLHQIEFYTETQVVFNDLSDDAVPF